MKVLVTGGAGFIGAHVAQKLQERGYTVIVVDNFNTYYDPQLKEARLKNLVGENAQIYRVDIADKTALDNIFKENKIDVICHLAAQAGVRYSLENPHIYEESNVAGTLNLLECARQYGVDNFVFASSSSVYGNNKEIPFKEEHKTEEPASLYAATKKATELLAYSYHKLYGINAAGLRYFTVYGPWGRPDMALFKFTKNILEEKKIDVYGNGNMERDFTYVDDIAEGTILALEKDISWDIINLGYGSPVPLMRFIDLIEKHTGKPAQKNFLPMQPGDVKRTYADTTKAKDILGWQPDTDIEKGIARFISWYRDYYSL